MNYKNLMFILQIQKSHSASFICVEFLQVSAMVQASQSSSGCSESFFFLFHLMPKHADLFQHLLMSSACKYLVYLVDGTI